MGIFGDSISFQEPTGWVPLLRNDLRQYQPNWEIFNLGITANTSGEVAERMQNETKARDLGAILLAVGVNDGQSIGSFESRRMTAHEFRVSFENLIQMAKDLVPRVAVLEISPIDPSRCNPAPWNSQKFFPESTNIEYNDIVHDLAAKMNVKLIEFRNSFTLQDLDDGVHPTEAGHRKISAAVNSKIASILSLRKSL